MRLAKRHPDSTAVTTATGQASERGPVAKGVQSRQWLITELQAAGFAEPRRNSKAEHH